MQKTQVVHDVHLSVEGMKNLDARLTCPSGIFASAQGRHFSVVKEDGTSWQFYEPEEFLAEYRPGLCATYTRTCKTGIELRICNHADHGGFHTRVIVQAPNKAIVQAIFDAIDGQPCIYFDLPSKKKRGCRIASKPKSTTEARGLRRATGHRQQATAD